MAKPVQRKFGTIPEWAKTGPIGLRNYPYRAEQHCSVQGQKRNGLHPTITHNGPDFPLWHQYFERHLGGRPTAFEMLLSQAINEMTVPEPVPQWFDPSFVPDPTWKSSWPEYRPRDVQPGRLFNVLVRTGAPQYAAMVARGESFGPQSRWWRHDPEGRGVWVPHNWLDDHSGGATTRQRSFKPVDFGLAQVREAAE